MGLADDDDAHLDRLHAASSGTARVAGYDVFEDSMQVRKRIGYLPESVPLYTEMSVWDYLDFVARLRNVPDRDSAIERVMDMTSISDRADTLISKLSKAIGSAWESRKPSCTTPKC